MRLTPPLSIDILSAVLEGYQPTGIELSETYDQIAAGRIEQGLE